MALLEVDGIDVYYGDIQALRGLSIRVEQSEMVAIIGPNGAGKTTTLRTISGMLAPKAGSITFDGDRVDGLPPQQVVRRGVTHLPEGRELFPSLSVLENLRMGAWSRRKDRAATAESLDNLMDLFPRLRERSSQAAGTLSGGEQQMLGIARALMPSPRLLIVDELSLGLAPIVVQDLFAALHRVNDAGTAVLIVEQFVHMALSNTHRAYVLAKGSVVTSGSGPDLLADERLVESYLGGSSERSSDVEGTGPDVESRRKARA